MNRELKLRAWDNFCKVIRNYDELRELTLQALNGDDWELERFTGLQDVNGQDVYEGDIIQYSDQFYEYSMGGVTDRETGYVGSVVKNNGAFGILINRISYTDAHNDRYHVKDFVPFCEFDDPESDMALKGNVHESPELLEADK
ncbi:YopX family protein [Lactiplantibacillus plantarum]|uniref:YopX family protein n=1 Tax=Lactiplantibacillus plantarum TaxID=1590 RepID=UPI000A271128|nr:YopX family protein [Lactiplantibacillus plantarum]ASX21854.1 hypothetical protein BGV74_08680 [Lactiplantibacillus plantarum]WMY71876.1 YopX family protein [Lactiplantibacillus plantarum]